MDGVGQRLPECGQAAEAVAMIVTRIAPCPRPDAGSVNDCEGGVAILRASRLRSQAVPSQGACGCCPASAAMRSIAVRTLAALCVWKISLAS